MAHRMRLSPKSPRKLPTKRKKWIQTQMISMKAAICLTRSSWETPCSCRITRARAKWATARSAEGASSRERRNPKCSLTTTMTKWFRKAWRPKRRWARYSTTKRNLTQNSKTTTAWRNSLGGKAGRSSQKSKQKRPRTREKMDNKVIECFDLNEFSLAC